MAAKAISEFLPVAGATGASKFLPNLLNSLHESAVNTSGDAAALRDCRERRYRTLMRLQTLLKANPVRATPSALPARAETDVVDPSDAELIERMTRGDAEALDLVLRRYWSPLVVYLIRLTGGREAAEDIAQRTFFQLWERRGSWQPDGSLRGLIYRIARNFAISERRRFAAESRSVAALAELAARSTTPLELLEDQQLRQEIGRAIQALPERRRETFILRCLHDLSYKEIAQVMDTSPQTVANQLSSALATLRQTLRHLLDE